jgi:hypothetical protein
MTARRGSAAPQDAGHGRTRARRAIAALDPQSAPVDERPPAYFLAFAAEYARLLQFHELDGSQSGDWSRFVEVDISFLLAEISSVRVQDEAFEASARLRRLVWRAEGALQEVIDYGYMMLWRIERWYRRALAAGAADLSIAPGLALSDEQAMLTMFLESLIDTNLRFLLGAVLAAPASRDCWLEAAHRAAPASGDGPDRAPWYEARHWRMKDGDAPLALEDLPKALNQLQTASGDLQRLATASLARTLGDVERHPAHTTLYIAFVKLLGCLQADANRFTDRHLDHYYRTILQLRERAAQPDRGHVMLQLVPDCHGFQLARGSLLSAGKDGAGTEILYATDSDLDINQGRIGALCTLYFARRPGSGWIEHALAAPAAASQDGLGLPLAAPELGWPTFGRRDEQQFPGSAGLQARFGFLILSPVLLLTQGKRHVRLGFSFDDASLAALPDALRDQLQAGSPAGGAPPWRRILRAGLNLAVSGAKGWTAVPRFFCRPRASDTAGHGIDVIFTLAADQPAVLGNPGLEGAAGSAWPMVRITLDPNAGVYLYSAFARAVPAKVDIAVDVRGLDNVELSGALGPMSAAKPFMPFGSLGAAGGYVDLYHEELGKDLQHMSVELAWQNLPPSAAAFQAYYDGYPPLREPARFSARLARHSGRRWLKVAGKDGDDFPLFGAAPASLATTRLCFVPPRCTTGEADAAFTPAPRTAGTPAAGTVRIALAAPAEGFGHGLYQHAFTERALRNAAHLFAKDPPGAFEPAVNPPIIPMAASIRCNYVASDSIALRGELAATQQFRYLHPFGSAPVPPDSSATLLADDGYDGRLYIGLAGVCPPQTISLHFQLRERSAAQYSLSNQAPAPAAPTAPTLAWRYLADDVWHDFDEHAVRSDTADLSRSGIIRFALPRAMNDTNGTLPAGLFWIEARARGVALDSLTIGVLAQAVAVTRRMNGSAAPLSLPPYAILGLQRKVGAVKSVLQPYPTTGGRAAESPAQLRIRASERLRHKQRASQPDDYEQLLLDEFDGLRQVKCISHNNSAGYPPEGRVAPGAIRVALVGASAPGSTPAPLPLHRLREAAEYLQQYVSGFVREISVRNCEFEQLKVHVAVELRHDCEPQASIAHLNHSISAFLAPWIADPDCPLELGCGKVNGYQIAELIRNQPYVKTLGPVRMSQLRQTAHGSQLAWIAESGSARLATPWSVFMPAARHAIRTDGAEPVPGIGNLVINADFVVGGDAGAPAPGAGAPTTYFLSIPSMRAPAPDQSTG